MSKAQLYKLYNDDWAPVYPVTKAKFVARENSSVTVEESLKQAEALLADLTESFKEIATKQDKAPDGSNELIVDNKINPIYIPDVILGQLQYGGVFNDSGIVLQSPIFAIQGINLNTYKKDLSGFYFIYQGPSQSYSFKNTEYGIGDWAVCNGFIDNELIWAQIKNTDAVTGVKGANESVYRKGQINITPDNIGAVSVDATQTITGSKTFSKPVIVTDSVNVSEDGESTRYKHGAISDSEYGINLYLPFKAAKSNETLATQEWISYSDQNITGYKHFARPITLQAGLNTEGSLSINGSSGVAGQVLTSQGPGIQPKWMNVQSGGGSDSGKPTLFNGWYTPTGYSEIRLFEEDEYGEYIADISLFDQTALEIRINGYTIAPSAERTYIHVINYAGWYYYDMYYLNHNTYNFELKRGTSDSSNEPLILSIEALEQTAGFAIDGRGTKWKM